MLTENEVIDAVEKFLENKGYTLMHKSNTNSRGVDLEMKDPRKKIIKIEAKGQTSSKPTSNRNGEEFNSSQKEDHVAKALLTACEYLEGGNYEAGIALPGDKRHKDLINGIKNTLKKNGIRVFFVDPEDNNVTEF